MPYHHIRKILLRAGCTLQRIKTSPHIDLIRKEIIADINDGKPIEAIWARHGLNMEQLYYILESDPNRKRLAQKATIHGQALAIVDEVLTVLRKELADQGVLITLDEKPRQLGMFDDASSDSP